MYEYIKGEQKEWRIRKADRKNAEGIKANNGNLWDLYQRCTKGLRHSTLAGQSNRSRLPQGR